MSDVLMREVLEGKMSQANGKRKEDIEINAHQKSKEKAQDRKQWMIPIVKLIQQSARYWWLLIRFAFIFKLDFSLFLEVLQHTWW